MNKEKLNELLKSKQAKIDELIARSTTSEKVEELRSIHQELTDVKKEMEDLRSLLNDIEAEEARMKTKSTVLATYGIKKDDQLQPRHQETPEEEKRAQEFIKSNKLLTYSYDAMACNQG